jgi:PPE-repeat protein
MHGPSSVSMAAATHVAWMTDTARQAEQAANQARAAAAARDSRPAVHRDWADGVG